MHSTGDGPTLLDLLREAGDEAVTFDELELVWISDPALALWDLELAGVHVQRVFDQRKLCVKLAAERAALAEQVADVVDEQPTVEIEALWPPVADATPAMAAAPGRPVARTAALGLFALLLLVLFARRR